MATLTKIVTRSGKSVDSPYSNAEALVVMRETQKGYKFADELYAKAGKYGLSEEQWKWVHILAVEGKAKQSGQSAPAQPRPTVSVGSLRGLKELLAKAKQRLKYPKIRLRVGGRIVALEAARDGSVRITDTERRVYSAKYGRELPVFYGKVDTEGKFEPFQKNPLNGLSEMLRKMAEDPAATAAEYGRLTGACCFCGRKLTTTESTTVGYGPDCAEHYGLPWGTKVAKTILANDEVSGYAEADDPRVAGLTWNPGTEEFDGEDAGWYNANGTCIYSADDKNCPLPAEWKRL